jgi:hypothetical protein
LSEEEKTQTHPKKKKVSLKEFVDSNHNLLTAIGVMGALVALFTRLENSEYLTFFSFAMLLLLDWELWVSFPKSEEVGLSLWLFELFSQLFFFAVGFYILTVYGSLLVPYTRVIAVIMVLVSLYLVFIFLNLKYKPYAYIRKKTPEGKRYSSLVRGIIAGGIFLFLFVLALLLVYYLNQWLSTVGL